jgi:hypothetical protein
VLRLAVGQTSSPGFLMPMAKEWANVARRIDSENIFQNIFFEFLLNFYPFLPDWAEISDDRMGERNIAM